MFSLMHTQHTGVRGKVWLPQSLQTPPISVVRPSAPTSAASPHSRVPDLSNASAATGLIQRFSRHELARAEFSSFLYNGFALRVNRDITGCGGIVSGKSIGARVLRTEDARLLTGRGEFVDDIRLPGMLHAAFVRASYAHARIRGIDASAALALPGVHAVLIWADLNRGLQTTPLPSLVPNPYSKFPLTQLALAKDEVCYVGEAVAIVVAESRHLAEDAAALVAVDYESLPAISGCRDAVASGAALTHSDVPDNKAAIFKTAYGDAAGAFRKAAHVFKEELWIHRGCGHALECRGVLADVARDGTLTVWSSTQTPHLEKRVLADLLERRPDSIRVIAPDVGGGFGPKAIMYGEDAIVAAAALRLNRPVKWIEDRREHFLATTQERDQYWSLEIALDGNAKLLGVRGTMLHDTGAYMPWGVVMPYIAATTVPGPYLLPAYELEVTVAYTNKVPTTPVRGAGRPQAVFVMERLLDRAARELKLDPAELRRRNLIGPDEMPYAVGLTFRDGKPLVYHGGDFPRGQTTALAMSDYEGFRARQVQARESGRYIGIGVGNYVEGTGLGPFEGVTVRVLTNGKVAVATGATNQGQGQRTTLSQIVADEVGCRIEDVVMTMADTAAISQGVGAFASRQAINAGSSALLSGISVKKQIVALAALTLGVPQDEIDVEDGVAIARTGNKPTLTFAELAKLVPGVSCASGQTPGLEHTSYFTPPQASYCNGTHVAEVEVDPATGGVTLLR